MQVRHKITDTRHHYVRAVGYHHLYAQWPVGTQCSLDSISAGEMPPLQETLEAFRDAAQRAADDSTEKP